MTARTLALAAYLLTKPIPAVTPGAVCSAADPDFRSYAYPTHVALCRRHVTAHTRLLVFKAYGIPRAQWHLYELDHLVPISFGGSNSPLNLWPEPWGDASDKDVLEAKLARQLRVGRIDQATAIRQLLGR